MHCLVFNFVWSSWNQFSAFELVDLFLEISDELAQGQIQRLAALENSVWWSYLAICLNLHFNFFL